MAILDDIEVRIVSKTIGKALSEYDKPNNAPSEDGLSIVKFIKGEPGLEFHIEVFVKSSFSLFQAPGIQICIDIDGGKVESCMYISRKDLLKQQAKREPIVFGEVYHQEGTQYSNRNFIFGSLNISEKLDVENGVLGRQARALGSIKVSVARVTRIKLSFSRSRGSHYNPSITEVAAKEIVGGRNISHTVKPRKKTIIKTPKSLTEKCRSYPGRDGRPLSFIFQYRSQTDLELLGCNPDDTEPLPLILDSQRARDGLTLRTIEQCAEQTSQTTDGEEPAHAKGDNDLTATENFGVAQGMGNVVTEQPQKKLQGNPDTIERNDRPMEVQSDQHFIKPEESGGLMEVRTEALDLENQNSQLFQTNQLLHTDLTALKQTEENLASLIQNLTGDMTNASAIPSAAVLTSTLPVTPVAPSEPPTLTSPSVSIKRERIEEDHEEGPRGSA